MISIPSRSRNRRKAREFGIAVEDEITRIEQKPIDNIGEITGDLYHECIMRNRRDAGDVHRACRELDEEQHVVGESPWSVQTSTVKTSVAASTSQWALRNVPRNLSFRVEARDQSRALSGCSLPSREPRGGRGWRARPGSAYSPKNRSRSPSR